MDKKILTVTLVSMFFFLSGCASNSRSLINSYMRENVNIGNVQTIAVLPFTGGRADLTRDITVTNLLASGLFDVVDQGRVDTVLRRDFINPGDPIDAGTFKRLGQLLKVQAFLLGSVNVSQENRGNAVFFEITLTLRLIDSDSGLLLWRATGRGSGYSLTDRLLGMAPKDAFQVTVELLDTMFATMQ